MTEDRETEDTVNIAGIDKAALLAALYNGAMRHPLDTSEPMTVEQAMDFLAGKDGEEHDVQRPHWVDHCRGRALKIDFGGERLRPDLYDRDNGPGTAARIVDSLRSGVAPVAVRSAGLGRMLDASDRIHEPPAEFLQKVLQNIDSRGCEVRFNLEPFVRGFDRDLEVNVALKQDGRTPVAATSDGSPPPVRAEREITRTVGRMAVDRFIGERVLEPIRRIVQDAVDAAASELRREP